MSAASGGCSEPERAGQRRRAMRAHMMREVSATRRNRKSSAAARTASGRAEWFCKAKNLIHALLAQLVEQLTLNQRAQGSSPWKCTKQRKGAPKRVPLFFVSMEFERLGLHGAADAGPGCPGGERRQWRMQRTGAGWAAAQSDASAYDARSQRDTPQPDESLEVHHKKAGQTSCLFCCTSPLRGRLHRSR